MKKNKRVLFIIIFLICITSVTNIYAYENIDSDSSKINSKKAVIIDRKSKKILYGKNENVRTKMASTTKIMTAMVVIQNTNLENIVEISKKAAGIGGSKLKLKKGDKITVKDLLYGLMLRSGNDAAVALAEHVSGSVEEFAELMNENARDIGLTDTNFISPHGLDDDEHYTTAYELALITDYALQNEVFSKIVNTKSTSINVNGKKRIINNTNELLGNLNGVYGVKTGFTNGAGRCLVTSVKRGDLDIICVVLGADAKKNRTKDSIKLIENAFKKYEIVTLNKRINEEFKNWNDLNSERIYIEKGEEKKILLELKNKEEITYPIIKNTADKIDIKIIANIYLKAPVNINTEIGKLSVIYNDEVIKEIGIVNINRINKKRINTYIADFFENYNKYLEEVVR